MDHVLNALITFGPGILFLALVLAIVYAALGRIPRDSQGKRRFGRYVLGLSVVGTVAFIAGAALGIAVFCSSADAGNLCGLGGVFGSGPLLAGFAIAIYAYRQGGSNRTLLIVCHFAKETETSAMSRLISARKATKNDVKQYERK